MMRYERWFPTSWVSYEVELQYQSTLGVENPKSYKYLQIYVRRNLGRGVPNSTAIEQINTLRAAWLNRGYVETY